MLLYKFLNNKSYYFANSLRVSSAGIPLEGNPGGVEETLEEF
jgi:hypothetical protein